MAVVVFVVLRPLSAVDT